jgi:trehalose synthase
MRTLRETSGVDNWIPIEPAGVGEGYDAPYLLRYELELRRVAARLREFEVVHVNSTGVGGGVAEILSSLIPLSRWYGLETRWLVIPPDNAYFGVTRRIHDLLQGEEGDLSEEEWETYLSHVRSSGAPLADDPRPRVWFVHDHQLLPLVEQLPPDDVKVWVSHVDTSEANPAIFRRLVPFMQQYDRISFSLPQYVPGSLDRSKTPVSICPPAIDPLPLKNQPMPEAEALAYTAQFGIDPERPFIAQISRFDPWKDPIGVIDAYRLIKQELPGLQLALVGALAAADDAKAVETLDVVRRHANGDSDIHLYWDPLEVDQAFVRAFQAAPQVVLQKSTREGFGLTVTEAMWKGKAVVGGNVGGIAVQIVDGVSGFLVDDVQQCARRTLQLLRDPDLRRELGVAARARVEEHGLLPRLLRDYVRLAIEHPGSKDDS